MVFGNDCDDVENKNSQVVSAFRRSLALVPQDRALRQRSLKWGPVTESAAWLGQRSFCMCSLQCWFADCQPKTKPTTSLSWPSMAAWAMKSVTVWPRTRALQPKTVEEPMRSALDTWARRLSPVISQAHADDKKGSSMSSKEFKLDVSTIFAPTG